MPWGKGKIKSLWTNGPSNRKTAKYFGRKLKKDVEGHRHSKTTSEEGRNIIIRADSNCSDSDLKTKYSLMCNSKNQILKCQKCPYGPVSIVLAYNALILSSKLWLIIFKKKKSVYCQNSETK